MRLFTLAFLLGSIVMLCGCDLLPEQKYTANNVVARPSATESGMMWGGDQAKIVANIDSVVIECIPIEKVKNESSTSKSRGNTEYEIAASASVTYSIIDQKFFKDITLFKSLEPAVIFEAMTASGVVIGHSRGTVRVIENGSVGKVSAKIMGLTREEIKRIKRVEARWEYGR